MRFNGFGIGVISPQNRGESEKRFELNANCNLPSMTIHRRKARYDFKVIFSTFSFCFI